MKVEQGCTIIKTKELSDLYKEIDNLKIAHAAEIKQLKENIKELEEAKKPDELRVKLFIYKEVGDRSWSSERFMLIGEEISEKINLSIGIHRQIRRILNIISSKYDDLYKTKYNKKVEELHKKNVRDVNWSLNILSAKFTDRFYSRNTIMSIIQQETIKS